MKHNKFIVYDNKIIVGRVRFHKELLPNNHDRELINGGGLFEIDQENKFFIIIESSKSFDFGKYPETILNLDFENEKLNSFTKVYQ